MSVIETQGRTARSALDPVRAIAWALHRFISGFGAQRVTALALGFAFVWLVIANAVWVSALTSTQPVFLEPQGNIRSVLGEEWAQTGKPAYDLEHLEAVPANARVALTPRDAAMVDGQVVPKDFAYPVAAAAVALRGGHWGLALLPPLVGLLASLAVGLVAKEVTGSLAFGAVATALAQTSLVWWSATYGGVSFTPASIGFGMASVAVLLRYRERAMRFGFGSLVVRDRFLLSGFLGGLAAGWHYGTLPWWGALVLAGCVGTSSGPSEIVVRSLRAIAGAIIGFGPVLFFNWWLYGSPTATGYSEFASILEAIDWQGSSVGFSPSSFRQNVLTYALRPETIPLGVAAVYGAKSLEQNGIHLRRAQLVVLALGAVALVGVSGGSTLWGTGRFTTNASFLRYMAPTYSAVLVLAAAGLAHWWRSEHPVLRLASVAFVALVVPVNIVSIVEQPGGLMETRNLVADSRAQQQSVLATVPDNGIVITRRFDKLIFPHRSTMVAAYLRTTTPPSEVPVHLYDTFPEPDRVADVVLAIDAEVPVFLFNDTGWVDPVGFDRLSEVLEESDVCVFETDVEALFRFADCGS